MSSASLRITVLNNINNMILCHAIKDSFHWIIGIIGNKAFTDILLDLVTLNLGTNNLPSSWMHLTRPELQELTSLLTVNLDFVDWRKFLLVASLPWPIALDEELLETLQRFKAVDEEQSGTITFQQYMQAGLWFTGDEDIKVPEDPFEPLPFNRQGHLIEFFFRLFADFEKDPPLLDYTWMLLYFACHPDPVEGVYRALSVATGTRIFQPIETATVIAEENYSFTDMCPTQESPDTEGHVTSEKRELRGEREAKEEEIPANANTEKISMETLLQVFRGGQEGQGANQPVSPLRRQNIYAENFIKVFQDLGAKNLEPIEAGLLLKHPFIQDLILSYPDYKIPVSTSRPHPGIPIWLGSGSERSGPFEMWTGGRQKKLGSARAGSGEAKPVIASGQTGQPTTPKGSRVKHNGDSYQ